MKNLLIILLGFLVAACNNPTSSENQATTSEPEAYSFSGEPLYARKVDSIGQAKSDSVIQNIRSKADLTEEDYIVMGRSLSGIGRFRKAVDVYSEGLEKFPSSYKLLRFRGHRYINLRQLEKAIADLNAAEELIRPEPPIFEFDAAGNQGASYQHQIWYHIGLYHFLNGKYTEGASAFEKSLATAYTGSDKAGASDWLYNCYMRTGDQQKAAEIARPFTATFDIENKDYPYFRRLLLFNKAIQPGELVDENKPIEEMSLYDITKLYGLANHYRYAGDTTLAKSLYQKVLSSSEWAGFAYAAAELDVR